ncbi:hypothetical protein [Streptomyces cyaneofuscatus]|uniref:hypothetical protein n=1 Tax=Streptomyces cyaneofuscatus TaxID=66883 RepID=UPI003658F90B
MVVGVELQPLTVPPVPAGVAGPGDDGDGVVRAYADSDGDGVGPLPVCATVGNELSGGKEPGERAAPGGDAGGGLGQEGRGARGMGAVADAVDHGAVREDVHAGGVGCCCCCGEGCDQG